MDCLNKRISGCILFRLSFKGWTFIGTIQTLLSTFFPSSLMTAVSLSIVSCEPHVVSYKSFCFSTSMCIEHNVRIIKNAPCIHFIILFSLNTQNSIPLESFNTGGFRHSFCFNLSAIEPAKHCRRFQSAHAKKLGLFNITIMFGSSGELPPGDCMLPGKIRSCGSSACQLTAHLPCV